MPKTQPNSQQRKSQETPRRKRKLPTETLEIEDEDNERNTNRKLPALGANGNSCKITGDRKTTTTEQYSIDKTLGNLKNKLSEQPTRLQPSRTAKNPNHAVVNFNIKQIPSPTSVVPPTKVKAVQRRRRKRDHRNHEEESSLNRARSNEAAPEQDLKNQNDSDSSDYSFIDHPPSSTPPHHQKAAFTRDPKNPWQLNFQS